MCEDRDIHTAKSVTMYLCLTLVIEALASSRVLLSSTLGKNALEQIAELLLKDEEAQSSMLFVGIIDVAFLHYNHAERPSGKQMTATMPSHMLPTVQHHHKMRQDGKGVSPCVLCISTA
eukprot:6118946-Amphidinium_carterae.1